MHIYFVGIGGAGIGPLALIASQAGYEVSGSDFKDSEYTSELIKKGIDVRIYDQNGDEMEKVHVSNPIDQVIGVSAIIRLNPGHGELTFARDNGIRITERDSLLNEILKAKNLKMIAAAGTQGKTTTTAMFVWALKTLNIPISYSLGAKTSFADMGHYEPGSEYFVYECDEFHRNFLQFYPYLSVISGIAWDHHEVFPSPDDYNSAFREFVSQTDQTILWDNDAELIGVRQSDTVTVCSSTDSNIAAIDIPGEYNRRNAWLVARAAHRLTGTDIGELCTILSSFPGSQRRMEELSPELFPGLFTDYAHTPEKITGCMSAITEIAASRHKKVVIVYEPLTNRRQHYVKEQYAHTFDQASKVYWVPSYLAREDPKQAILTPAELITYLHDPVKVEPAVLDDDLWANIQKELIDSIVICMSGGGGNSLDEWLRGKIRAQVKV
jgi:UDP-N-acetylmuramate--alanine ligase